MAAGADRVRAGGVDPGRARRRIRSSGPGFVSRSERIGRGPESASRTAGGRAVGPGADRGHPGRDPARRPDDVRPVHGDRALRPDARLLPIVRREARSRGRLPDRARGPSDLRSRGRPVRRRASMPRSARRRRSRSASPEPARARWRRRSSRRSSGRRSRAGGPPPRNVRYLVDEVDDAPCLRGPRPHRGARTPARHGDGRGRRRQSDRWARDRERGARRAARPTGWSAERGAAGGPGRNRRRRDARSTSRRGVDARPGRPADGRRRRRSGRPAGRDLPCDRRRVARAAEGLGPAVRPS